MLCIEFVYTAEINLKRPATIKNTYRIDFKENETPINKRKDKEFYIYYDTIWKDLDIHVT